MAVYTVLPYVTKSADGLAHGALHWFSTARGRDRVMDAALAAGLVSVRSAMFVWETWCVTNRDAPAHPYRRYFTGHRARPITCLACLACASTYDFEEV